MEPAAEDYLRSAERSSTLSRDCEDASPGSDRSCRESREEGDRLAPASWKAEDCFSASGRARWRIQDAAPDSVGSSPEAQDGTSGPGLSSLKLSDVPTGLVLSTRKVEDDPTGGVRSSRKRLDASPGPGRSFRGTQDGSPGSGLSSPRSQDASPGPGRSSWRPQDGSSGLGRSFRGHQDGSSGPGRPGKVFRKTDFHRRPFLPALPCRTWTRRPSGRRSRARTRPGGRRGELPRDSKALAWRTRPAGKTNRPAPPGKKKGGNHDRETLERGH